MKNSNDTIGNRSRDLPACSTVPQPTAPPRASRRFHSNTNYHKSTTCNGTVITQDPRQHQMVNFTHMTVTKSPALRLQGAQPPPQVTMSPYLDQLKYYYPSSHTKRRGHIPPRPYINQLHIHSFGISLLADILHSRFTYVYSGHRSEICNHSHLQKIRP